MKLHKGFLLFGIFLLSIGLSGCPIDAPEPIVPPLVGVRDGTATGLGDGFARNMEGAWHTYEGLANNEPGRHVEVTVTVLDGFITEVLIYGPDESPGWRDAPIAQAPGIIIARNTFNLVMADIDALVRATDTVNGINEAGNNALDKLRD